MSEELVSDTAMQVVLKSHENIMSIHIRALACHCECLGMNAENCQAMCADAKVPFGDYAYNLAMQKWGLINEKGNPII